MTIIQKIKHRLADREAAKRRKLERLRQAVTDGWNAAQAAKPKPRFIRIRFDGIEGTFGLN